MSRRRTTVALGAFLACGGLLLAGCGTPPPRDVAAREPAGQGEVRWTTGLSAVDALQERVWPTLESNRRDFVGVTGRVRGFGAGDRYPQLWLRDSATLVPVARYYVAADVLTSWIEEHLAHQEPSGALYDWIAPGEPADFPWAPQARVVTRQGPLVVSADRNTTEADQEASAVLAASRAFAAVADPAWLRHDVAGRPLLTRLDAALEFVLRERRDPRGLIVGALTADWGDVSPTYPDQRAIYLDAATPRVAPLYANALFVGAAHALARLHAAVGDAPGEARWIARADAVTAALRAHLWQPGRGRFRIHAELPETPAHPDDTDMLAFGGNAVAALHGLFSDDELAGLLAGAEQAHATYGIATLAGSLLPPYPAGFFTHPALTEPWTYQNGGQWDWFAGRFLLALYAHGQSAAATRHLAEIAARVEHAGGFYEWYTRDGRGRGSARYAGSAAALARAVIEGLFGIELNAGGLRLHVRLGARDGRVSVREPASGRHVAYTYAARVTRGRLRLALDCDPSPSSLEIRLPPGSRAVSVSVAGRTLSWQERRSGRDRYVSVAGPVSGRVVVIGVEPEPAG